MTKQRASWVGLEPMGTIGEEQGKLFGPRKLSIEVDTNDTGHVCTKRALGAH